MRESLLEAAGPVAKAGGHRRCECDVPDSLPVMVDAQRMSQVVDNLVSNAIKYTPPRRAASRSRSASTRTGSSWPSPTPASASTPPDRDRLFTRFFRARHAEERSIQGVGLGLSITKSIVESHGGRIEVESELGQRQHVPGAAAGRRPQAVARPRAS